MYTPQIDYRHDHHVYDSTTVVYVVHTTVVPHYYGHGRYVCSTDAPRSQDGNTHQPNYYVDVDVDVDVDGVYERRPRPLCPPHLITLRFTTTNSQTKLTLTLNPNRLPYP